MVIRCKNARPRAMWAELCSSQPGKSRKIELSMHFWWYHFGLVPLGVRPSRIGPRTMMLKQEPEPVRIGDQS